MRVNQIMEQEYKMEKVCAWCNKRPTGNKDYTQYLLRGNICSVCSAKYAESVKMSLASTDKQRIYRQIDEHRQTMNLLGEGLSLEITEAERVMIEYKMQNEFNKMRELRKELW